MKLLNCSSSCVCNMLSYSCRSWVSRSPSAVWTMRSTSDHENVRFCPEVLPPVKSALCSAGAHEQGFSVGPPRRAAWESHVRCARAGLCDTAQ